MKVRRPLLLAIGVLVVLVSASAFLVFQSPTVSFPYNKLLSYTIYRDYTFNGTNPTYTENQVYNITRGDNGLIRILVVEELQSYVVEVDPATLVVISVHYASPPYAELNAGKGQVESFFIALPLPKVGAVMPMIGRNFVVKGSTEVHLPFGTFQGIVLENTSTYVLRGVTYTENYTFVYDKQTGLALEQGNVTLAHGPNGDYFANDTMVLTKIYT